MRADNERELILMTENNVTNQKDVAAVTDCRQVVYVRKNKTSNPSLLKIFLLLHIVTPPHFNEY